MPAVTGLAPACGRRHSQSWYGPTSVCGSGPNSRTADSQSAGGGANPSGRSIARSRGRRSARSQARGTTGLGTVPSSCRSTRSSEGGYPLHVRQIPYDPASWRETLGQYETAEVFHSPEWLAYLLDYKHVEPVIAELTDDGGVVGHFVGAVARQLGLRVLGSPLSGWATNKMGFLLRPGTSRVEAARALLDFAYRDLGCVHVELFDRHMQVDDARSLPYVLTPRETFEVDLTGSEQDILAQMQSRTRTYVRRASRVGLHIEEVESVDFADEYYEQLVDVFASSALVPTHGIDRVRSLVENVGPSGQLLMLRVRDPDGTPVASILTLGRGTRSTLWGLAWYRTAARLHPVEPLQWEAMRRWRERGARTYDLDGSALAKKKFGGQHRIEAHLHHSRHAAFELGRNSLRTLFYARQRMIGRLRTRGASPQGGRAEAEE